MSISGWFEENGWDLKQGSGSIKLQKHTIFGSSAVDNNMFLESNASWIPRTYLGSSIPRTYLGSSIPGTYVGSSIPGTYVGSSIPGTYIGSSIPK